MQAPDRSKCPMCGKPVKTDIAAADMTWPFCSQRCKMADLNNWLDGVYSLEVTEEDASETGDERV
jgi:uncharacterized protein